jgi:hypothetical protein
MASPSTASLVERARAPRSHRGEPSSAAPRLRGSSSTSGRRGLSLPERPREAGLLQQRRPGYFPPMRPRS